MTSKLDYSSFLLIRKIKDEELDIYIHNVNTKIKRHILTVSKFSRVDMLDSKTLLVTLHSQIRIIDIESKELLQTLDFDESSEKMPDRFNIGEILYSPYIPFFEIERKSIKHLLIPLVIDKEEEDTAKLYKYKDRRLVPTGIEIKNYDHLKHLDTFFSGDKYLVERDEEGFGNFTVWNLENMKVIKIILRDKNAGLLRTPYNTLLASYIRKTAEGKKIFFEEIDPENGKILRKMEPDIPTIINYSIHKDHNNEGEYIIFLYTVNVSDPFYLYLFRSFDKNVYSLYNEAEKIKMIKSKKLVKRNQKIKRFRYLENGNLLFGIYDRRDNKNYEILYNIDTKNMQIFKRSGFDLYIADPISKDKFLYGYMIVNIDDGDSYRISMNNGEVAPFILQKEKDKMKKKVIKLLRDNFIPTDIKKIIATFI